MIDWMERNRFAGGIVLMSVGVGACLVGNLIGSELLPLTNALKVGGALTVVLGGAVLFTGIFSNQAGNGAG